MANSAIVGILRALLTANSAEFEAAMKRSASSARAWQKELKSVGQQATQVGTALTKTLTLPIVGLGGTVAKLAIDFESSFAGVRKTVDASEAEFAALAQGFRDLSKTIPINVNELNKIGEAAGQLGIKTENILGFTDVMAKLGVTTNLSSDQAATALARLANITGMPQTQFDRLGSTIVALGNNFATTESEIVEFGLRIAGAGEIAGLTEHQILAIGAAMSSVGVEAEAGGTAVQKVLNGMTEAVATSNAHLEVFAATAGMSAEAFATAFRQDAAGAFQQFVTGLQRSGDQAFTILDELGLGNERVIRAFLSLANAGDLLSNTLRVAGTEWERNTALTEEARRRFETTASQLTLLWNRVKDVGVTLGNALLPMIQATIGGLDRLLPVIDGVAKAFVALPTPVQVAAAGVLGLTAAAGPAIFIFGQLALSASALAGAFTKKGLATVALGRAMSAYSGTVASAGRVAATHLPTFVAMGTAASGGAAKLGQALMGLVGGSRVLTVALGALRVAFGALWTAMLPIAATVGAIWAAFKLADWSGLTDWVGKKLAGAFYGVSEAEYEASRAAAKTAEEHQKLREGITDLSKTLGALAARDMAAWTNATADMKRKAAELKQDLPGAVIQVENLASVVRELGEAGQLTPSVLREVATQAKGLQAQGATLPPILQNIVAALDRVGTESEAATDDVDGLTTGFTKQTEEAKKLAKALQEVEDKIAKATAPYSRLTREQLDQVRAYEQMGLSADEIALKMGLTERTVLAVTKADQQMTAALRQASDAFTGLAISSGMILDPMGQAIQQMQALTKAADVPMLSMEESLAAFFKMGAIEPPNVADLKKTVTMTFVDAVRDLPNLLIKAFTGGGGIGGALNAFGATISQGLFGEKGSLASAVTRATGGLTKVFGSTIGAALGAAIPGIGALIGPGLQALWGGIKKLFGGPSAEELAGRDVKAAFQASFGGFEAMLGSINDAYLATGRTSEQARQDVERLMAAEKQGAEAVKAVIAEINRAFEEQQQRWEGVQQAAPDLNAFVEDGIDSLGEYNIAVGSAVAIFDAWVEKTGDVAGALQQIGPALDAIQLAQTDLGFAGNAAIDSLLRMREVTAANEPLMQQIGQSTQLLQSLGQAGILTNDLLTAFGQNAFNQFTVLEQQTGDARQAMVLMQPQLQALWEAQEKFGQITDESTAALLEQAEQQGLVGPEMKSVQEQTLDVMKQIRDVLADATGQAGRFGEAIGAIPDRTIRIGAEYDFGDAPELPGIVAEPEFGNRGGLVTPRGIEPFQHFGFGGFAFPKRGTDIVPAMLTPGELVLNRPQQQDLLELIGQAGGLLEAQPVGAAPVNVEVNVETSYQGFLIDDIAVKRATDDYLIPAINDAILRDSGGIRRVLSRVAGQ